MSSCNLTADTTKTRMKKIVLGGGNPKFVFKRFKIGLFVTYFHRGFISLSCTLIIFTYNNTFFFLINQNFYNCFNKSYYFKIAV